MTYLFELEMKLKDTLCDVSEEKCGHGKVCKRGYPGGQTGKAFNYLVEAALEVAISLGTVIPLFVHDPESNVLVGRAGNEPDQATVVLASGGKRLAPLSAILSLDSEGRSSGWIDEVGVEDVELVALHDLGWRVVVVVMGLVVLVPFIAHLDAIEVEGAARLVSVGPGGGGKIEVFFGGEGLLVVVEAPSSLTFVQGAGGARGFVVVRRLASLVCLDSVIGESGRGRVLGQRVWAGGDEAEFQ